MTVLLDTRPWVALLFSGRYGSPGADAGRTEGHAQRWNNATSHCRRGYAERDVQLLSCPRPFSRMAKFWLSPSVELARNIGLSSSRLKEAERLAKPRQQEIIDAWNYPFRLMSPTFLAIAPGFSLMTKSWPFRLQSFLGLNRQRACKSSMS